ncbi:hypothetical protein ES703_123317 [subsurface metagenome]
MPIIRSWHLTAIYASIRAKLIYGRKSQREWMIL